MIWCIQLKYPCFLSVYKIINSYTFIIFVFKENKLPALGQVMKTGPASFSAKGRGGPRSTFFDVDRSIEKTFYHIFRFYGKFIYNTLTIWIKTTKIITSTTRIKMGQGPPEWAWLTLISFNTYLFFGDISNNCSLDIFPFFIYSMYYSNRFLMQRPNPQSIWIL